MELRMVFKCDKFHPSALAVSQIYPSPMATPWVIIPTKRGRERRSEPGLVSSPEIGLQKK